MGFQTIEENLNEIGVNCYLISNFRSDKTSVVRKTIEKLGIGVFVPFGISDFRPEADTIINLINEADFVVAIINSEKDNASILFEIGIALGKNKTVFIISENFDEMPLALNNSPLIRCSINDMETFEHTLKVMLNAKGSRYRSRHSGENKKEKINLVFPTSTLLEELDVAVENNSEKGILKVIEKVFKNCSVNPIAGKAGGDYGEDFAIWSNELEEVIGNPIIIELKINLNNVDSLTSCENKIQKLLEKRKAQSAIVLAFQLMDNPALAQHLKYSNILFFEIREFIKEIGDKGLERTVRETRNAIARIRRSTR